MTIEGIDLRPQALVYAELRGLVQRGEDLRACKVRQLADHAGRTPRTIYRWAAKARTEEPEPEGNLFDRLDEVGAAGFVFDDVALGLYYLCGGNMRRFRLELLAAGYDVPSEATLSRRLRADVSPLVREGARTGHRNRHSHALHIRHSAPCSNAVYEVDEFTLDVEVVDGGNVIRPHLLLLIDDYSRFVVAWALLRSAATGDDVLALFADGFEVRAAEDGTGRLIGGVPELLTTDQGSAFRAGPVEVAFASIPSTYRPAPGFTPTAKGKVERAGQHIQAEVVTGLAGRTSRLERRDRTDLLAVEPEALLTFTQAFDRVSETIHRLNYLTPHSGLGGRTRIDAYDDGVHPRQLPEQVLAGMHLVHPRAAGRRKVHHDGLHVDRRYFISESLHPHIGTEVTVRVLHHRRERVAAFDGATFIGMAYDSSSLSETEREAIVAGRRSDNRSVNKAAKAARAASRQLNRNITTGGSTSLVDAYIDAHALDDPDEEPPVPPRGVAPTGLNMPRPAASTTPVPTQSSTRSAADVLRAALNLPPVDGSATEDGDQ